MIKVVFCLRRLTSLSFADFSEHWFNVHAPLVIQHRKALRIARYVQLHADYSPMTERLRGFRGSPEPYDGVAEIWYESRQALESLGDDQEARAASRILRDDERLFIDTARSPIWIAEERNIIPSPPD